MYLPATGARTRGGGKAGGLSRARGRGNRERAAAREAAGTLQKPRSRVSAGSTAASVDTVR